MKPNILLLHGALGSSADLDKLAAALSDDFAVHQIDFEGHGAFQSDAEFSMERFEKNAFDYLLDKDISFTHIFGYSMGGYVALNMALNGHDSIGSIITYGTKFDWAPESAAKEVKMLNPEKIQEKVPAFAALLKEKHAANDWKGVLRRTGDMMLGLGNGRALTDEQLGQIKQPIKICVGENDKMVSVGESRRTADLLSNGTLEIIEGGEHPIEKMDVAAMQQIVAEFTNHHSV